METIQARLAGGDPSAFAEIYDLFSDRLAHYLLVFLGSREDAADTLQETFLRLARNRKQLANVTNFEAYVFAVARNEAARLSSRLSRRKGQRLPLVADDLFYWQPNDSENRETVEIVATAMGQLTPEQREIVELKTYAELTFQQISHVTGLPQGTVASRYRTALTKMQLWIARQPK